MLINLTNHPSANWSEEQMKIALKRYGRVKDIPFPAVLPQANSNEVKVLANEYFKQVMKIAGQEQNKDEKFAVHIQGEFTFVYALVNMLRAENITCIASTSERRAVEKPDGTKVSVFRFVRFREYL